MDKVFWKSRRFWGLLTIAISSFYPKLAPTIIGLEEYISQLLETGGQVVGTLLAAWGMIRAKGPLVMSEKTPAPAASGMDNRFQ
jgi:hypothetical protein